MSFGEVVRTARQKLGWTQKLLAHRIGVTASFVTKLERNDTLPSPERVVALADELVLDSDRLLELAQEERRRKAQERFRTAGIGVAKQRREQRQVPESPNGVTKAGAAERLGRKILDDPDLHSAFTSLQAALMNPEVKVALLKLLEVLAREATTRGKTLRVSRDN